MLQQQFESLSYSNLHRKRRKMKTKLSWDLTFSQNAVGETLENEMPSDNYKTVQCINRATFFFLNVTAYY